jgi:hypothetical protein
MDAERNEEGTRAMERDEQEDANARYTSGLFGLVDAPCVGGQKLLEEKGL